MLVVRLFLLALSVLLLSTTAGTAESRFCASPTVVTIDIGHTPGRGGATSARGVSEYSFNKRLARFLVRRLSATPGLKPRLLNPAGKNISLRQRAKEIRRLKTGVFLSIHHDSAQLRYFSKWTHKGKRRRYSDVFSGHSLFVSSRSPQYRQSVRLGKSIGRALLSTGMRPTLHHAEPIKGENRPLISKTLGLYDFAGLAVLHSTNVPAVLLEAGMIVNRADEKKLGTDAFRERFSNAVIEGIRRFCR